ncbi:hypothetical protein JCM8208_002376 [Rhodotorula glutinis]
MPRATKPAVSPTSARTARPSRASTSKRVSYQEQDGDDAMDVDRQSDGEKDRDELEEGGDGQQDGSSGEPVVHKLARIMEASHPSLPLRRLSRPRPHDPADPASSRHLQKYEKSTIKPTEQRLASAQRDLRQIVDKGKREADSSVHKLLERNTVLVNAAHLDRLKPLTARPTADYESASSVLELQAQCLAAAVEASVAQGLKPEGAEDWLAVDARSRSAHRTLKKARESKRVLLDELNELDHESSQRGESMRQHFVEIALA